MNLKIYDDSQNYTAQVIKLPVKQTVVGLDNLVRVTVFGNDCLIGKDSPEDELYLFFPSGTQLSEAFCKGNNLYRELQLNADPNEKGFFELNRRVKTIKFRGIISSGFVIPVSSLKNMFENGLDKDWATPHLLSIGDNFNEYEFEEVCRKYFVPTSSQPGPKGDKISKINNRLTNLLVPNQFRFHVETNHLANNLDKLQAEDIVVITDKWHGSSCILSKVLISKKLTLWQKFLNKIGGKVPNKAYGYIYSSDKPKSNLPKGIEGAWINDGPDFYLSNIWKDAFDSYKETLEDGITIYGEIVGFTKEGAAIQKGYDYGCVDGITERIFGEFDTEEQAKQGTSRFVVYRITYTKPDGAVIEFCWQQVKDYFSKYGLEHVKEFFFGSIFELLRKIVPGWDAIETETDVREWLFSSLQESFNLEKTCRYCASKSPAEGIVLRIDGKDQYSAYKLKSKLFLKKESEDLDNNETNIEDQA